MGGTSDGPVADLITMWSGPILEGELDSPNDECQLTTSCFRAGRAQPDNREGDETCLAVLNNFYNDGVKFHDCLDTLYLPIGKWCCASKKKTR